MKTIFLAGAHTPLAPLPELVEEVRLLEAMLQPLHERQLWQLLSNRAANLDDVFKTFSRSGQEIAVFHYAGHANQQELHFEDGGQVRGLAELFGLTQGTALRLVFLNGCASAGLVDSLHGVGVAAVIATARPVDDTLARAFAARFYETWAMEGKSLEQAFDTATAFVHTQSAGKDLEIVLPTRSVGRLTEANLPAFSWGLYLNPALDETQRGQLLAWVLNPPPQLPPQLLQEVRPQATESLLELVYDFEQNDAEAQKEIATGKDPLLVLITRLPWTVGTHLRRLFAVEDSQSMAEAGPERLKELVSGYTELTRFISYLALSALWDERQRAQLPPERLAQLPLLPDAAGQVSTDYVWRLRQYLALQKDTPGDPFGLETYLEAFLHTVDTELAEGYRFIEALKEALGPDSPPERLQELVLARTGKAEGLAGICLQTETIFSRFLRAALFLTKFRLYTVRSILVDKIRYLDLKAPYVHKTMSLHGAFSDIKLIPTARAIASENACILFAPANQPADPLAGALNLSPFYIDKSAYLEDKIAHYPAIYVLKHQAAGDEFVYEYLDGDVNHQYIFAEDHRLVIRRIGAIFPPALKVDIKDSQRFQIVHQQLLKLNQDFAAV
ncbi:MAG: CHAT domain-containing protein [Saprospiraceae bacterium]